MLPGSCMGSYKATTVLVMNRVQFPGSPPVFSGLFEYSCLPPCAPLEDSIHLMGAADLQDKESNSNSSYLTLKKLLSPLSCFYYLCTPGTHTSPSDSYWKFWVDFFLSLGCSEDVKHHHQIKNAQAYLSFLQMKNLGTHVWYSEAVVLIVSLVCVTSAFVTSSFWCEIRMTPYDI